MPSSVYNDCVICSGQEKLPRNGPGGSTCSASRCKRAYKEQRALPTVGLALGTDALHPEKMPANKWVQSIEEILGERCCEPLKMSHKKRKNGPGASSVQEFLVRGYFLEDDGDANDEEEDDTPEPNTRHVLGRERRTTCSRPILTSMTSKTRSGSATRRSSKICRGPTLVTGYSWL